MERKLNAKETLFVQYYCSDAKFNATKAAILAGYSEKSARSKASQLLTKVNIQAAIQEFMSRVTEEAEVTTLYLVKRLKEESEYMGEGSSHSGRIAALKILTDYTGGFDKNKTKHDHRSTDGSMSPRRTLADFYADHGK